MSTEFDEDELWEETPEEKAIYAKMIENRMKEQEQKNNKEIQKQQYIRKNVCEIDYDYAVNRQSSDQNSVMIKYISIGAELNAAIRGENEKSIDYTLIKKLNENFAPIKNKKCSSSAYYIVYRCITKEGVILKSEAYMSTSNKTLVGFGGNCVRIFVPIETPVLVGDLSETTSMPNTYEILFPTGTTLIPMNTNGDFYIDTQKQANSGGRRKRSIKKKTLRTKRNVKLNYKNSKKIKGKREKMNRSKKTRR